MEPDESTTFSRGQMEAALWRTFSCGRFGQNSGAPPVFRNRIKRLLDIDQDEGTRIFAIRPPTGHGKNAEYDPFGVFQMGLALILLDAGYKQSDTLFLMRHISLQLALVYSTICECPPAVRQTVLARDRPPSFPVRPDAPTVADETIFLLLRKAEMAECFPTWNRPEPLIFGPKFCYGLTELQKEIALLSFESPSTLVIEIGEIAAVINDHMSKAELLPRGRKKTESGAANETHAQPTTTTLFTKGG